MQYQYVNKNPKNRVLGDCVVRAIAKVLEDDGYDWNRTYCELCAIGYELADMPSSNAVWAKFLINKGFEYHDIMSQCLQCYTIRDFADEHQDSDMLYLIGTGDHVVPCIEGTIYDIFNSGDMVPMYYFSRKKGNINKNE